MMQNTFWARHPPIEYKGGRCQNNGRLKNMSFPLSPLIHAASFQPAFLEAASLETILYYTTLHYITLHYTNPNFVLI